MNSNDDVKQTAEVPKPGIQVITPPPPAAPAPPPPSEESQIAYLRKIGMYP